MRGSSGLGLWTEQLWSPGPSATAVSQQKLRCHIYLQALILGASWTNSNKPEMQRSLLWRARARGLRSSLPRPTQVPVCPQLQTTSLCGAGWKGGQTGCSFCRLPKVPFRPEALKGGREGGNAVPRSGWLQQLLALEEARERSSEAHRPQHWRLKGAAQHCVVEGRPRGARGSLCCFWEVLGTSPA